MAIRVAINGFGRIGRLVFRNMLAQPGTFEVVAVNDLTDNKTLATLLKYDSTHRRYDAKVDYDNEYLSVNGKQVRALAERNPAELPWGNLGIDVARTKELDDHVDHFLKHKRAGQVDSDHVQNIKALIRRGEACAASRCFPALFAHLGN